MKCLNLIFFAALVSLAAAELFSAVEELQSLSVNEGKLIEEIQRLIHRFEENVALLKSNVNKMQNEHQLMEADSLRYISNPLNAFILIKTLSLDVAKLKDEATKTSKATENFIKNIEKISLPHSDFEGAVKGLTRLQETYYLRSKDLAKGIIQRDKYREELTVDELLALGVELINLDRLPMSLSYLKLAFDKNKETRDMHDNEILEKFFQNHKKAGDMKEAVKVLEKMIKIAPERNDLLERSLDLEFSILFDDDSKTEVKEAAKNEEVKDKATTLARVLINKACNNQLERSAAEMSKFRCRLVSNSIFSKLAPFKVEEANHDPYIAVFYDVISDKEVQVFKSMSRPHLARGTVLNPNGTAKVDDVRTAKLSAHYDLSHKVFDTLTKRVGDMSGLNMKTAEMWQTQNYGIGGHYDAHYDFTVKNAAPFHLGTGNRIATALFYLSDVEKGGATVFPFLSIKVQPKKGSALYWLNLSSSGDREYYTAHAACPVLVGSKWVANKWLHEYGQEWTRPCELVPRISDENFYNKFYFRTQ